MKKHLSIAIMLIIFSLSLAAQKTKDVLYLKNGSTIYGKLVEISNDQYKMRTSDGSLFIYGSSEVDKFARESPFYEGRRTNGFTFALEAGLLAGAQHTDYTAPFSFNVLAGFINSTRNIISVGSGVEFIGKPFTPIFMEYKYLIYERKTTPFIFARAGGLVHIGDNDPESFDYNYDYSPKNYKGGGSFAMGTGISWSREDYETYLSFAYRYAHTSYQRDEYNLGTTTYENSLNRLEVKFGFRF